MKPRARRITIGVAALVAAVLAGFVVAYWGPVRDHVEAWCFQLTRETETILPGPCMPLGQDPQRTHVLSRWGLFDQLAAHSSTPVVVATRWRDGSGGGAWPFAWQPTRDRDLLATLLLILGSEDSRVIEQRFPRKAYIIVRPPRKVPFAERRTF